MSASPIDPSRGGEETLPLVCPKKQSIGRSLVLRWLSTCSASLSRKQNLQRKNTKISRRDWRVRGAGLMMEFHLQEQVALLEARPNVLWLRHLLLLLLLLSSSQQNTYDRGQGSCWARRDQARARALPRRPLPLLMLSSKGNTGTRSSASSSCSTWRIVTANTSGWAGTQALLTDEFCRRSEVLCIQECKVLKPNVSQSEKSAADEGWKLRLGPAVKTDSGGVSAGVGVAVKSFIGVCEAEGAPPSVHHARSSIVWVNGCVRGGFYVCSLYFPDGEGVQ